jgi:hypothetical protein
MTFPVIKSPAFSQTSRRSRPVASGFTAVTGRWAALNATGTLEAPAPATNNNNYLMLEGLSKVSETATYTAGGAGSAFYVPSAVVSLPSAVAGNEAAVAFGVFVAEVGQVGYDTTAASAAVGAPLYLALDAAIPGGAVLSAVAVGQPVAVKEAMSGTKLIFRTLAQGA